ncbi:MAG: cofactor-independent phosphoglycerate mutase [Bacteroidetes bacterium GWF2_42_66]|nr:MAG: cofactor-independent phosphoglycerate mutase [Bacteroidetes bacterium GWA2_42_15]OFY01190.1 MAG: cofactor-independent phosphoglycerate mutase [Bacteroidetes bacterium GWE2_42_39]OFY42033.1 MAG: cofactor-independent phosphoglycerate mutase [Bacteroidetes bacterium GWF2_42_66]HBL77765.1 cofactor-independent phosphoglycerate mutase [Prolixibacteraceae bacterium]HCB62894.1 cofactor-independent phosphoglycerate mutase [Bacteroidales bacterium]
MKYIIVLGDGMADEPLEKFGGKTPLQMAKKPVIDSLAKKGKTGRLITVPESMHPGSEIANLAVLGYDVENVFEGRGVLEAASMGVTLERGDLAMRCNLICIENENIKNHSAGHISNKEAHELIDFLNKKLGSENVIFYPGVSYRHLLVIKGGKKEMKCTPPHDVPGKPYRNYMVEALRPEASETVDLLNELIRKSMVLLANHPVNLKRKAAGKDMANSIWPWSPGYKPQMPTLKELFGIEKSAVISAVDLIQGIGVYAGMDVIQVEGATGLYDTNYEGKAQATIDALKNHDLVYLHVEASDEAGHEGNAELKTRTIEYLDQRIVKFLVQETAKMDEPVTIAVLPDHPTPCATKIHTKDPVPFIIYKPGNEADQVQVYDEFSVVNGTYGMLKGNEFMKALLGKDPL